MCWTRRGVADRLGSLRKGLCGRPGRADAESRSARVAPGEPNYFAEGFRSIRLTRLPERHSGRACNFSVDSTTRPATSRQGFPSSAAARLRPFSPGARWFGVGNCRPSARLPAGVRLESSLCPHSQPGVEHPCQLPERARVAKISKARSASSAGMQTRHRWCCFGFRCGLMAFSSL